jgi:hypothetical protein
VEVRGRVYESKAGAGVEGAVVAAIDSNGAIRSTLVETGEDGAYVLPIPMERDPDGKFEADSVTLRVDAAGYQSFPLPPRIALPIDLGTAAEDPDSKHLVVQNAATDVLLLPRADGGSGLAVVSGHVTGAVVSGFLVVAADGDVAVASGLTASDGKFRLFNVPKGELTLSAFRQGAYAPAESVTVDQDLVTGVELEASQDGLSTVSGSISLVNVSGNPQTSVILVLASTFDPVLVRGEAPLGLRAGGVANAFSIEGVPPGTYVALAAFENDGLVRDPDTSIGGTDLVTVEVDGSGSPVTLSEGFKVTGALEVVSPGGDGMETIAVAEPKLVWADDSSEDGYDLAIYSGQGEKVFEDTGVGKVTGSATVSYTWKSAGMEPGMIYQFRVRSYRDKKGGGRTYISATEDLKGVFIFAP